MRIKCAVDLHISKWSGATITEYDRGLTNGIVHKMDDRLFVAQRPSIDVFEVAADHVADARGRGVFYWDFNTGLYIVNNDTVYKNSQSNSVGTISEGMKRCYLCELAGKLLLIDPENDEGYVIDVSDNVTKITDTDFPPEMTPAVGLAHGCASLNGTGYVLGEDGTIYGSDFEDLTSWSALNFITAEREPDGGTYIGKHHDNIVVMGPRTIEFFEDTANPTGSPLTRRGDAFYSLGCHDGQTVWSEGDRMFFVAVEPSGSLAVYLMEGFTPRRISNDTLDAFLTNALIQSGYQAFGSGFTARGHTSYKLTLHTASETAILPVLTLAYDAATGFWSLEYTEASAAGQFPVVAWTVRTGVTPRVGEGVLCNGDLITVRDDMEPHDSIGGLVYVEGDYVEPDYVEGSEATAYNITMTARLGMWDGGGSQFKFCDGLRLVADALDADDPEEALIQWADERTPQIFPGGRAVDASKDQRLTRLGRFRRRNHQIVYAGNKQLRLEAIEIDIRTGTR